MNFSPQTFEDHDLSVQEWKGDNGFFHNTYFMSSPSRKGRNDQPFLFRKPLA